MPGEVHSKLPSEQEAADQSQLLFMLLVGCLKALFWALYCSWCTSMTSVTSAYPMEATQFYIHADDLVLYKVIGSNSCSAYGSDQEDIDRIAEWTNVNLLNFNRSKCKAMLISRRQHQHQPHLCYLEGDIIEQVCSYK